MKDNKQKIILKELLPFVLLFLFGIGYLYFTQEPKIEPSDNNLTPTDVISIDTNTGTTIDTGVIVETGTQEQPTELVIDQECNVVNTGNYRIVKIMEGENKSPLDPKLYKEYTKLFNVSGNFEEAYGCVVSDLVEYRKKHHVYTYSTYILFNDSDYAGHLNVGYSTKNKVVYDYTTDPTNRFLNGRFWGDEAPKIYTTKEMDLSNLVVADLQNGGYKNINILDRLNRGGPMYIGGFVNAKNGEGITKKFIVAYKCKEGSTCEIK